MSDSREARFKRIAQEDRRKLKAALSALEAAEKENAELRGIVDEALPQLEASAAKTTREAFDKAAAESRIDPEILDMLFRGYPPEDGADEKAIRKHVAKLAADHPRIILPDDDDQADDEDGDEAPAESPKSVFDMLDAKPAKGTKPAKSDEAPAGNKGREAPGKGKDAPAVKPPAGGKLTAGEGRTRGTRDDHEHDNSIAARTDREFAATGRNVEDAFRI